MFSFSSNSYSAQEGSWLNQRNLSQTVKLGFNFLNKHPYYVHFAKYVTIIMGWLFTSSYVISLHKIAHFIKLHSALCGCVGGWWLMVSRRRVLESSGGGQCSSIISAPASENCLVCTCVCSTS